MLPDLFAGRRCYVLGGGPSLTREICDRLRGYHAIAVNSTVRLAPWAEVLFFSDASWGRDHVGLIRAWGGVVVTSSRKAAKRIPGLHFVASPTVAAWSGLTSGHLSLDVAAAMGATEIVLLGFDCRAIAGRSHCHDDYAAQWTDSLYDRVRPTWRGWRERMAAKGIAVVNATPGSAIDEFPKASLDQMLARPAS